VDLPDFRSDTVSWPTPEMREAIASARVGDDVYGEDPTVNELEALSAERVGPHLLPTDEDGRMDPAAIEAAVRAKDPHLPRSRLILVENSFGGRAGAPIPPDYFAAVRAIADRHGLAVHLDGARLFNAAVALSLDPRELTRHADSVTFCLSKGLCAPVGSVLCGSREFVGRARNARKSLGGGMRQAGVLAAAGLLGLRTMIDRLAEDHVHARLLAEGLSAVPGVRVDPARVRTNIVHFELDADVPTSPERLCERLLAEHRVGLGFYPPRCLRAVTHYWVGRREVETLVGAVRDVLNRTG